MVRKKLVVAIATMGALQASLVSALGMGEFSLNSALNQPLNAEIKLSDIADLDASQVLVKMADPEAFSNAGVSRDFFLTNVKFNVEVDGNGSGIIRVTTREPVVEPYLNFLVEARWPSGRMLREYTVLLDLPVFSDSAAPAVERASSSPYVASSSKPTTATQPTYRQSVSQQRPQQRSSVGQLNAGDEYRVKTEDTLWQIAEKSRPDNSVTVQQTMLGIQQLNPQAFINGNINRLRAGAVLRLPTRDQISISDRQAIGEVAKHNRAWKQGDDAQISTSEVQLDATSSGQDSSDNYSEGARLSIASGGESSNSGLADGEGSGSNGTRALDDALASAQEDLDKTSLENQELQSRLSDMESKLATLQRLVELKDDQLAALQDQAGSDPSVSAETQELVDELSLDSADGLTDEIEVDQDFGLVEEEATDLITEQVPVDELEEDVQPEIMVEEPVKATEQGFLDQLKSNPLYAGGAGLLVLAIAGLVFMRKRKKSEFDEDEEEFIFEEPETDSLEELNESNEEELIPEVEDEVGEDSTDQLVAELESQIAADNAQEEVLAAAAVATESVVTESTSVESETGDVIAEADIYVAYGRYQQAIDLLRTAIEQEPERTDIQLKLLEVYVETRDKPAFQQQYKMLAGLGSASAVEQVKEMLSTVDGVSDWLDGVSDEAVSNFTDEDMDAELIEGEAAIESEGDDEISLDLDDDFELDSDFEVDISEEVDLELDEELDFDELDLESDESTDAEIDLELDEDIALDLDLESSEDSFDGSKTAEFDVLDIEDEVIDSAEDIADDNLDLGDLATAAAGVGAVTALAADASSDEIEPAKDEEFDLDFDADMDLSELDGTDLSELESEFADINDKPEPLDIDVSDDVDNDIEFDLDEVPEVAKTADVVGELNKVDDSDETIEFSIDEVTAETEQQEFNDIIEGDDSSEDDDFDFLADTDEVATKLDLARAYIDMGDTEGAKDILDEVIADGNEQQIEEAKSLVEKMD